MQPNSSVDGPFVTCSKCVESEPAYRLRLSVLPPALTLSDHLTRAVPSSVTPALLPLQRALAEDKCAEFEEKAAVIREELAALKKRPRKRRQ